MQTLFNVCSKESFFGILLFKSFDKIAIILQEHQHDVIDQLLQAKPLKNTF